MSRPVAGLAEIVLWVRDMQAALHFYGDLFTSQTFPRGSLSLLLNKIREHAEPEGGKSPLLAKALAMRAHGNAPRLYRH